MRCDICKKPIKRWIIVNDLAICKECFEKPYINVYED